MNSKYKKYIEYIAKDIQLPYIKYLNMYGLRESEYELVLSKVYNQPVTIKDIIEGSNGFWEKHVYNTNGKVIYHEDSYGNWYKKEYDTNGNIVYIETSIDGVIRDNRYE